MRLDEKCSRRLREFGFGTLAAILFFLLWNEGLDDVFTWEMAVVSVVFGLFSLLLHWMMGRGKVVKWIGYVLMTVADLMGILWLIFVFSFKLG